jgi:hypothetical protein
VGLVKLDTRKGTRHFRALLPATGIAVVQLKRVGGYDNSRLFPLAAEGQAEGEPYRQKVQTEEAQDGQGAHLQKHQTGKEKQYGNAANQKDHAPIAE